MPAEPASKAKPWGPKPKPPSQAYRDVEPGPVGGQGQVPASELEASRAPITGSYGVSLKWFEVSFGLV